MVIWTMVARLECELYELQFIHTYMIYVCMELQGITEYTRFPAVSIVN